MKLPVTGGAGYVGSVVAPQLGAIISAAWEWMQSHPHGYG